MASILKRTFTSTVIAVLVMGTAQPAWPAEFRVTPGPGPFTLPTGIQPGDVVTFAPGHYAGTITVTVPGITLRSEGKWQAQIVGAGLPEGRGCWVQAADVVIDGFEIMGAWWSGINAQAGGERLQVRNCWIHHCRCWGIASAVDGLRVERCLIEWNGSHLAWDHALYVSGQGLCVQDNVIRNNSDGINAANASGGVFTHNTCYDNLNTQIRVIFRYPPESAPNRITSNNCFGGQAGIMVWGWPSNKPNVIGSNRVGGARQYNIGLTGSPPQLPTVWCNLNVTDRPLELRDFPEGGLGAANLVDGSMIAPALPRMQWAGGPQVDLWPD